MGAGIALQAHQTAVCLLKLSSPHFSAPWKILLSCLAVYIDDIHYTELVAVHYGIAFTIFTEVQMLALVRHLKVI